MSELRRLCPVSATAALNAASGAGGQDGVSIQPQPSPVLSAAGTSQNRSLSPASWPGWMAVAQDKPFAAPVRERAGTGGGACRQEAQALPTGRDKGLTVNSHLRSKEARRGCVGRGAGEESGPCRRRCPRAGARRPVPAYLTRCSLPLLHRRARVPMEGLYNVQNGSENRTRRADGEADSRRPERG